MKSLLHGLGGAPARRHLRYFAHPVDNFATGVFHTRTHERPSRDIRLGRAMLMNVSQGGVIDRRGGLTRLGLAEDFSRWNPDKHACLGHLLNGFHDIVRLTFFMRDSGDYHQGRSPAHGPGHALALAVFQWFSTPCVW